MKNNVIIIHGSYGNPYKNWFPWLKESLSKRGIPSLTPAFTTPEKQDYEIWSKILKAYLEIGYINETTTFITHSLGGIFTIKFLLENNIKIKKLITVAGFNNLEFNDDMNLYNSFYMSDNELNKITTLIKERICIYSDTDPYVPLNASTHFADTIKATKVLIKNAGHFSKNDGYETFKEILKYLK